MMDRLRIAELPTGTLGGVIGLSLAPGKKQAGGMSGSHDRDLDADFDVVASWNAAAIVTLMEEDELRRFRIDDIGEAAPRPLQGMAPSADPRRRGPEQGVRGVMAAGVCAR